ncbi:MAG: tRNA uridine-5-carboxymethylaminomethyl(34) synthesis GTPase MnmE [Bacteroidaceae bacterium]|nr:tRNA uridine-5-carboxymethylaminomethyl(34) synthesis GTPase MnmE [Bacteroidaceae bacterium]
MSSTICAISTAKGGAIGIIRISGPKAIDAVDKIFEGRQSLKDTKPFTVHFGNIVETTSDKEKKMIDEVLVTVFHAPHSYTGEDSVEISCHGSSFILDKAISLLMENGCEMAKPGEYTQRAFLNGKMDLSQAEAVADLIASQNEAMHRIAMNQMRGAFSKRLSELRHELLEMTSLLELELDFSEEDVQFADREKLINIATEIEDEISHLVDSFATGNAIKNGIPVAIIGAPNVGKSTLLNQLLHDDRAIVSDIQGTTRDIIEDTITINGHLFRFIDTAGIRHTSDTIEQMGIERSLKAAEKAQIIILMTEPGIPFPKIVIREDQHIIEVINKSEEFQALTGQGLDWLERELLNCIPSNSNDDILVTNLRHKQALSHALEAIQRAKQSLEYQMSGDIISEDLRQCLSHLAEIVGEISTDEVLGNIFSKFCVGK